MDVTKPYKFIGFGAMDVTKPYKFIRFGDLAWVESDDKRRAPGDPGTAPALKIVQVAPKISPGDQL